MFWKKNAWNTLILYLEVKCFSNKWFLFEVLYGFGVATATITSVLLCLIHYWWLTPKKYGVSWYGYQSCWLKKCVWWRMNILNCALCYWKSPMSSHMPHVWPNSWLNYLPQQIYFFNYRCIEKYYYDFISFSPTTMPILFGFLSHEGIMMKKWRRCFVNWANITTLGN